MAIILTARDSTAPRMVVCLPHEKLSLWTAVSVVIVCFFICIASMMCICLTVILQATKMKKYTSFKRSRNSSSQRSHVDDDKKKTIIQACLYILAFIITYTFPVVSALYSAGAAVPYAVIILTSIFYPLAGV